MHNINRSGYSIMSAIIGGVVWCALGVSMPFGNEHLDLIELLLLLAILVLVPIGLDVVATPDREGWNPWIYRFARFVQPFAAAAAVGSFFLPVGAAAGTAALLWLLFAIPVALFGAMRFLTHRFSSIEEVAIDAGLLYLPVGGAWLVASRLGLAPLGFGGIIALLTAVHFHYAGFVAPIVSGLAGRYLGRVRPAAWPLYRIAAIGIIAGPPLVALGITFSAQIPIIELLSALILATSITIFAGIMLLILLRSFPDRRARILLGISTFASVVAMIFAFLYALGSFLERPFITTLQMMAIVHGCANALFSLGALLCWSIVRPQPRGDVNAEL